MAQQGTRAEVDERVEQVEEMLLDGKSTPEVTDFVTREWGLSAATAKNYIARARARTAARLKDSGKLDALMGWVIHGYRFLYHRSIEKDQLGVAKSTLDSLADLFGLKRPVKIDVQHKVNGEFARLERMSDAQLVEWVHGGGDDGLTPVENDERGHTPSAH